MEPLYLQLRPLTSRLAPLASRLFVFPPMNQAQGLLRARLEWEPAEWLAFQGSLAVLLGLVSWVLLESGGWAAVGMMAGVWLPVLWLKERRQAWQRTFVRPLPDVLDLLTACVEAGSTLESAAASVVEHSPRNHVVKQELARILYELRMGRSRREAFLNSAKHVDVPAWSSLMSSVVQAEHLGTSVVETLRVQSQDLRIARRQSIERQALQAPVKLLFPLVVFIFPTTFLVIFAPMVLRFWQ